MSGGNVAAIVIMGVAGCGKSTVGAALASQLNCIFVEGDSLHPPENITKMESGIALDDDDRWPWLGTIAHELAKPGSKVASCSALKLSYREYLVDAARPAAVHFAYLDLPPDDLQKRVESRVGHFWLPELLPSQLAILERPDMTERNAKAFDGSQSVEALVASICGWLDEYKREENDAENAR